MESPSVRPVAHEQVATKRWSAVREEEIPIRGVRAAWHIRADAALAKVLAAGEVLGIGKGTTFGKGVLRVGRLG